MVLYGQVVAGPPGSGKTTYCNGMQEYLRLLGRNAWVINLDPANEVPKKRGDNNNENDNENNLPYEVLLDVCESVVNLSSVMKELGLGPNGGLVYCMEYLEAHVDEILNIIEERIRDKGDDVYLIFDLPGQVELYTHGNAVPRLLSKLVKILDLRLVAVQLIDAHYCTEPANFLSAALLGTTVMLKLELPTVNVLSKIDLLANYGPLPFSLEFFTDCHDLDRLVPYLQSQGDYNNTNEDEISSDLHYDEDNYADDPEYQLARKIKFSSPFFRKHERLHKLMAEVVEDFGLISFLPLDISSAESVGRVLSKIDKSNGYIFTQHSTTSNKSPTTTAEDIFQVAMQSDPSNYETIADIQERISIGKEQQHNQEEKLC
jgi:GTPase SAR1 family protein